ncbi:non-ribosomal peptide synthetase [Nocardia terpenica]|uniref:non-ribosomal peptide synthetase n=1 Tax=Nocardia terpenica TaxID=455432 RepID=UPI00082B28FF|nr:non-ribosomal peptide synthetase [Nocardia terpenica]NQE87758.1 non-ribosomal peptide synthetase [Nocardia terpenica]
MSNDAKSVLDRRRELLRRRMAESGVATAVSAPAMPGRRAGERARLSAGQRRMWFLQTRGPRDTTLNICVAYRLSGALDPERLRAAAQAVIARHEILRTTYGLGDDGEPYQILRDDLTPSWETHDLRDLPEASRGRRLEVLARREFGRPFDLASESPLRLTLVRTGDDEFALVLVAHHICWDDDSWAVFFGELNAAYRGAELPALPGQFADIEDTAGTEAELEFWRRTLRPLPEPLELPGRAATASAQADLRRYPIPPDLVERVEGFAREHAASPFMVLLAAWNAVIHRYTAAADFLVSVPTTVRRTALAETLIGYFGNTLLLRAPIAADDTFASFVATVRETCLGAFAHQGIGIDRVVREANPERHGGRDGLEQLVRLGFAVRKTADGFDLPGVASAQLELGSPVAQVPLGLTVVLEPGRAHLEAAYRTGELESTLVERMLAHYVRLLDSALAAPHRRLAHLDMLGTAERVRVLAHSHGELVVAAPTTMVALFEHTVATRPDAVALVAPDTGVELDYAALNVRANRLAHWLIRAGIGPEDIVGLRLSNSVEFVVAVLGVLKAGAAYLPIDPAYPQDRIDYLVNDARPRIVLGRTEFDEAERDATGLSEADPADADRIRPLRPHNLAYVIYTSGSTGKPKGVPVPHHAIAEHLEGFAAQWGMTAEDRLLQSSSVSFDASLLDIFVTFTVGARLVVPKPDAYRDIPYVADVITRCRVTVLHMVPSMLSTFLLLPEVSQWRALRHVPVGGEALPGEVADRFATVFDAELRNHYGPTEAVVCATHMPVEGPQGTSIVPIGVPNRNVYAYLLDESLQLVPDGVVGEIYLGGGQLARGYLNRPGLTADRFVADPFGEMRGASGEGGMRGASGGGGMRGSRLYRTGDLARRNAAGEIEFVGRADEQVKVRGFRIELGEVEAAVAAHPAVGHCVVIAVRDEAVGAMLAAYVVPASGARVDLDEVRARAAATLPDYMVPSAFAEIEEIPLTVHGKLDRRALPTPERAVSHRYREPATATEARLVTLFERIFDRDGIGADDSFFELGGHSLLATRLIVLIRAEFGVRLDVRAPFDTPTVAGLAALIEAAPADVAPAQPALARQARPERIPLSHSQLALWFQRKLEGPSPIGNIPFAVRLDGPIDPAALTAALGDVVHRHEGLRTVFPEDGGVPYQHILPPQPVEVPVTVLDDAGRLTAELDAAGRHCFAVETELLIRPHLFVLDERTHVLSLLVHHLVADHWSFRTILDDVAAAYAARAAGVAPQWAPLPVDYADYALWQRNSAEAGAAHLDYWRDRLAGMPEELTVATDRPRPAVLGKNGHVAPFTIPADLRRALGALAEQAGASEFMLYQAAVATLLHKLGAGVDIPLGTPVANRVDPAAADLVGLLANMVVLRNDLTGDPTPRALLRRSRDVALDAYAHQEVPIERVVEALNPPRSRSRNPLFQAMMHFREEDWAAAGLRLGAATVTVLPLDFDISLLDLSINFFAGADGGFDASVIVNADLYDPATAESFARRMIRVLTAFAEQPDLPVSELDVLTGDERRRLTGEWATGVEPSEVSSVAGLLRRGRDVPQVRTALRCDGRAITYRELFDEAARVPGGYDGDTATIDGVVRLLAALDQGLELPGGTVRFEPHAMAVAAADRRALAAERRTVSGDRAFGSADVRLIAAPWGSAEIAVELLAAVADGATLVLATEAQREDPVVLVELIREHAVTHVVADPATLARFVHTGVSVLPSVLRWDVLGTSWPAALPDLLPALAADSLATFSYRVPGYAGAVARGALDATARARPIPGARVLVLDERGKPVPPGVFGDVYIGGAALATVSAGDVVPDPCLPDERLLRTGDRARWSAEGRLSFATNDSEAVAPRQLSGAAGGDSETERRLIALLEELLEIEDVRADDNFFALGGDSVISIQWSVRANEIGLPLSPQLVFEQMTIADLAAAVDDAVAAAGGGTETDCAPVESAAPEANLSGLSDDALAALGSAWKAAR